ncbi:MAG TPA: CRISPR-associated endonuclease Cas2 [bacterium]|nr:CRISPR-associated endonuclease Cas2 [bacterium]HNT67202.1 CRISPR-associated endonuclease Cas2 [bacterium]
MIVLVSYDIIDDRRRTKLAKRLEDFGKRVQYSVFECELDQAKILRMKKVALKFIDEEKDSLRIYYLCKNCSGRVESWGIKTGIEKETKVQII